MSGLKPVVNISLNPTYYCNFRCGFCYLTETQLGSRQLLGLDRLEELLQEVNDHYLIEHVDLYGGEVLLLPDAYHQELKALLSQFNVTSVNVNTNLSLVTDVATDPDYTLSVSYDFGAREKADKVLENLLTLPRQFRVLTLVSREFLDTVTAEECVQTFNLFSLMEGMEFKPYSSNQANQHTVGYKEFEDFVYAVLTHPDRNFHVENELLLESVLDGTRNAFSDNHLYITPEGQLAVLEFDANDHEFFLPVDGIKGYQDWCSLERSRVVESPVCGSCTFAGKCLSEHLRPVVDLTDSCNGFHDLIVKWSET